MSEDIHAKAQAVLDRWSSTDRIVAPNSPVVQHSQEIARYVLTLEARLDLALTGCMQMREWLGSEEARGVVRQSGARSLNAADSILAALIAAMPGGDA